MLKKFKEFYSKYAIRFWIYVLVTAVFAVFFTTVLSNKNSRYSMRLQQSENRISTRMQMMRNDYLRTDSIFRHEQDSLHHRVSPQK